MTKPYRMRDQFLSPTEAAFYHALSEVLRDQLVRELLVICPKVALGDLVTVLRPNENVHHLSKLHRQTIDFILIHKPTLKPAIAIELDYPKQTQHRTDHFLEEVFLSAGLPFLRMTAQEKYDPAIISRSLQAALKTRKSSSTPSHEDFSPLCPHCGIAMVLRFHRSGHDVGKKYYGCLNFPECREVIPIS